MSFAPEQGRGRAGGEPLLEVRGLSKHFPLTTGVIRRREIGRIQAVDDVSLTVAPGETLGVVGESGSGKSTLCRAILQLVPPTAGSVRFRGTELVGRSRADLRPLRREMQMIFQDPQASLNPRRSVGQIVAEPLRVHRVAEGAELRRRVQELLERVGLSSEHHDRFPREFSSGQRQRVGIARALALSPKLIIADEPVSALDVSIQAQIINLLADLQDQLGLAYLFVAHDLGVVAQVSDRVAVMYLGRIVELAPAAELFSRPIHPYTKALLLAVPSADPRQNRRRETLALEGDPPSAADPPPACRFHPRCPRATAVCGQIEPPLVDHGDGHLAACHHPLNS